MGGVKNRDEKRKKAHVYRFVCNLVHVHDTIMRQTALFDVTSSLEQTIDGLHLLPTSTGPSRSSRPDLLATCVEPPVVPDCTTCCARSAQRVHLGTPPFSYIHQPQGVALADAAQEGEAALEDLQYWINAIRSCSAHTVNASSSNLGGCRTTSKNSMQGKRSLMAATAAKQLRPPAFKGTERQEAPQQAQHSA